MNEMKKTGIYKIVSKIDCKAYYGSAARTFQKRWDKHIKDNNANLYKSKHLQNAWNLYGQDNFEFVILEIVERGNLTKKEFKPLILAREQIYLDKYWDDNNTCYNIDKIAGSSLGIKRSDETKAKNSAASKGRKHTDEAKAKISKTFKGKPSPLRGRKRPAEAVEKTRKALTGRSRLAFSEEWRHNISEGQRGRIPWNKGKKHSPESIEKMRSVKLGKRPTAATRAKLSAAAKNRKDTPETIEKKRKAQLGERGSQAKLKTQDVVQIKQLLASGNYTDKELAVRFNISYATIRDIKCHRTWTHITID